MRLICHLVCSPSMNCDDSRNANDGYRPRHVVFEIHVIILSLFPSKSRKFNWRSRGVRQKKLGIFRSPGLFNLNPAASCASSPGSESIRLRSRQVSNRKFQIADKSQERIKRPHRSIGAGGLNDRDRENGASGRVALTRFLTRKKRRELSSPALPRVTFLQVELRLSRLVEFRSK